MIQVESPYKLRLSIVSINNASLSNYQNLGLVIDNSYFFLRFTVENRNCGNSIPKKPDKSNNCILFDNSISSAAATGSWVGRSSDLGCDDGVFESILVFSPRTARVVGQLYLSDTTLAEEPKDIHVGEFSIPLKNLAVNTEVVLKEDFYEPGSQRLKKSFEQIEFTLKLEEEIGLVRVHAPDVKIDKDDPDLVAIFAGLQLHGNEYPKTLIEILKEHEALLEDAVDPYLVDDIIDDTSFFLNKTHYNSNINRNFRGVMPISDFSFSSNDEMVGSFSIDFTSYPRNPIRLNSPMKFWGIELYINDICGSNSIKTRFIKYYIKVENKYAMWQIWRWLCLAWDHWNHRIKHTQKLEWVQTHEEFKIPAAISISSQTISGDIKQGLVVDNNSGDENYDQGGDNVSVNDAHSFISGSMSKPYELCQEIELIGIPNRTMKINIGNLVKAHLSFDFMRTHSHVMEFRLESAIGTPTYDKSAKPSESDNASDKALSSASTNVNNVSHNIELLESIVKELVPLGGISSDVDRVVECGSGSNITEEGGEKVEDNQFGPKGHFGIRRFFRKTAYNAKEGLSSVGSAIKTGVVHTASTIKSGVTAGATTVAGTITAGTGRAVRKVESVLKGDTSLVGDLMLKFKSVGKGLHGKIAKDIKDFNFVVIKYGPIRHFGIVPFPGQDISDCGFENYITIDVDAGMDNLTLADSKTEDGIVKKKGGKGSLLPYDGRADIYFFNPCNPSWKVAKRFKISNVLPLTGERSCDYVEKCLKFNSEIGLSVTLVRGEGLMTHDKLVGDIFINANYANEFGSSPIGITEHRSRSYPNTSDVDFKETAILFDDNEQICDCHYIRLQICGGNLVKNYTLGYVFIPIEDFSEKEAAKVYSVTHYKGARGIGGRGGSEHIGIVHVRIKRIVEDSQNPIKIELKMKASLRPKSIYNTIWQADAFLQGAVDGKHPERLSFYPSHRFLTLFGDDAREQCSINRTTFADLDDIDPDIDPEELAKASEINDTGIVSYYENDQRDFKPPFDWRMKVGKSFFTSIFDNRLGLAAAFRDKLRSLDEVQPPEGYEWAEDKWTIDKFYCKTDSSGWTYGVTHLQINENLKKGISNISPSLMSSRRRKWSRKIVMNAAAAAAHAVDWHPVNIDHDFEQSTLSTAATATATATATSMATSTATATATATSRATEASSNLSNCRPSRRPSGNELAGMIYCANGTYRKTTWREEKWSENKNLILRSCLQKKTSNSPILIPWKDIISFGEITPGVLYITFKLNRFFGVSPIGAEIFRPAVCDLFVQNCPAKKLEEVILKRIMCNKYRNRIYDAISTQDVFGSYDIFKKNPDLEQEMILDKGVLIDKASNAPVSTVLSVASQAFSEIESYFLEESVEESHLYSQSIACRLKLYQALLLINNLNCGHNFTSHEVNAIIDKDLALSLNIKMADEVDSANSRIEFLLDAVEMRIKDTVIGGWQKSGGELENAIEILINGYFLEIISIIMAFFSVQSNAMNSLQGKIKLIGTYMRQNDKLGIILDYGLKYFNIFAAPQPKLSHFLKLETLLGWYGDILLKEMKGVVDNAIKAWIQNAISDKDKQDKYKSDLPWFPIREREKSGLFISHLPEDVFLYLNKYLEFAQLDEENIAESFQEKIWKVDANVCESYALACRHLSEEYIRIVQSSFNFEEFKDKAMDMESDSYIFDEKIEWLSSVINDCRRIINGAKISEFLNNLRQKNQSTANIAKFDKSRGIFDEVRVNFYACIDLCISMIAQISMLYVIKLPYKINILSKNYCEEWGRVLHLEEEEEDSQFCSFSTIIDFILFFLGDKTDYLDELCFAKLLDELISRFMTRVVYILVELKEKKIKLSPQSLEILALQKDILTEFEEAIKNFEFNHQNYGKITLAVLLSDESDHELKYKDCRNGARDFIANVSTQFTSFSRMIDIITCPKDSGQLTSAVNSMLILSVEKPKFSPSIANLLVTCMELRRDHMWSPECKEKFYHGSALASAITNAVRRGSLLQAPSYSTQVFPEIEATINSILINHKEAFDRTSEINAAALPLEVRVFDFLNKENEKLVKQDPKFDKFRFNLEDFILGPSKISLKSSIIVVEKSFMASLPSVNTSSVTSMFSWPSGNKESETKKRNSIKILPFHEAESVSESNNNANNNLDQFCDSKDSEREKSEVVEPEKKGVLASIFGALAMQSDKDNDIDNDDDDNVNDNELVVGSERDSIQNTMIYAAGAQVISNFDNDTERDSEVAELDDDEEENQGRYLRLYDIHMINRGHFEGSQKCYLMVHYADFSEETEREADADWREYDHIKVPIPQLVLSPKELVEGPSKFNGRFNKSRLIHVKIDIFFEKSVFSFGGADDFVGTVDILVDQADFVSIVDTEYKIDFNRKNKKVEKMLMKIGNEKISAPCLCLSCFLVHDNK